MKQTLSNVKQKTSKDILGAFFIKKENTFWKNQRLNITKDFQELRKNAFKQFAIKNLERYLTE